MGIMLPRTRLRHVQILVLLAVQVAAQELLDLYVHERFIKFPEVEDDGSGDGGCEKCKVTDVCAPVRTYAIQSACMQTIGSEGSHLWEGNDETICIKSYSNNQECSNNDEDVPLAANNNNNPSADDDPIITTCDYGYTPNVCVEGAEGVDGRWKAATQFTRLIDHCVESSETTSTTIVEDFVIPMIEVRTFPTLEQCQEQNSNYEQIYLPVDPNLCTTSTIEIGYPGSVRLTCDDQNTLVQESYSDLECSKQDTELLDNPILRISSSECTSQNSLDGGHGTEYRRAYCTSPTYYCKSLYDTEFGVNVLVENSEDDNASKDEDPDDESLAALPYSCVSTTMLSCLAALLSLILL